MMTKRITIFVATVMLLFFIGYFSHNFILTNNNIITNFNPLYMYIFHAIACLIVYILVELVLTILPNETGYLYLALTMIKLGVFVLIFQNQIFSETKLTGADKSVIIIPLFLFLITETAAVVNILNNKQFNKKS
ncbi:DUF6168 family protein [Tenacibaculum geojense]|uniref:DUF6168 family protein n=1 Tax=Tenacibaculum geojense TaxID=915352 RepID=A0ABW3JTM4_9FLAO